ncbi:hypothetical protein [Patulibacter minatonensis]|uniref:hypothetical protein n=1 Tax=Patulibacter minatonensis TaxID=298163 RepID=UPI00047A30BB|nr:hypothetical protein [Patulibacter minatonensis]
MSSARRQLLRRTAIAILLFGSGIAAFVYVIATSRDLADGNPQPGERCIYRAASGEELCGERARSFCVATRDRRASDDRTARDACDTVLRAPTTTRETVPEG